MKYAEFEKIMSQPRMGRYLRSTGNNSKDAMTLYRRNLELSQELFTVISCLEISLRNRINQHYTPLFGNDWLRDSITGMFAIPRCRRTKEVIESSYNGMGVHYSHPKLLAKMDFGFWRFLFASPQFFASGATLLHIFPARPTSTPALHYNHTFVFNQLGLINDIRNRIAHHEPICFQPHGSHVKDTTYVRQNYALVKQLFQWMSINESALLYGLDHVGDVCDKIDAL